MAHLQHRWDPRGFLRVHPSFIVNLKYVKEVRREMNGDSVVILDNGQKVAMGRSYRSSDLRLDNKIILIRAAGGQPPVNFSHFFAPPCRTNIRSGPCSACEQNYSRSSPSQAM